MCRFGRLGWFAALVVVIGATGLGQARAAAPLRQAPATTGLAQGVDVHLVMALDASGSVDDDRFELQKQGYARAFLSQRVLDAIRNGNEQAIAVTMLQWTGPTLHLVMVPWMVIRDRPSALAFAAAIDSAPRQLMGGGTSLSGALDFSVLLLNASPYRGGKRVIDISGDGSNNLGRPVEQARDEAVALGIRINGLPILVVEPDLDVYFRQNVIGGPGAFIVPVRNYDAFGDAILRKLVAEISQDQPPHGKPSGTGQFRPKLGENVPVSRILGEPMTWTRTLAAK